MSDWISVEDRLPEDGMPVLTYGAKRLEWAVMRYSAVENAWEVEDCSEFHPAYPPKYWQELPPPPPLQK